MEIKDSIIDELCDLLVSNYDYNKSVTPGIANIVPRTKNRIIFIIGAGASNAADGLPLGDELGEMIETELISCIPGYREKLEEEIVKLSSLHPINNRKNFRTIAFASSNIDRRKTIDIVKDKLVSNLTNNYAYDILAYLLCSGYIDAIISFNFDEIFDNILHSYSYSKKIIQINCDKDISSSYFDLPINSNHCHIPIYIKAHGTLSKEETLRFARSDNHRFQPLTYETMKRMFETENLKIITVGFKLKFLEMSKLISENAKTNSEVFLIDKDEDIIDINIEPLYKGKFLQVTDNMSLDMVFRLLKDKLVKKQDLALFVQQS